MALHTPIFGMVHVSTPICPVHLCSSFLYCRSVTQTAMLISAPLFYFAGQSDTDTIDSVLSQDSRLADPAADPTCVIVTPDLLSALCGLLANLLAVLPEFTLSALTHSQLFQSLARSEVK